MDKDKFPNIEILPIMDRIINAGLWIGRLFTKQVVHEPQPFESDHYKWNPVQQDAEQWLDKWDLNPDVDRQLGRGDGPDDEAA